jgi:SAM-dependent methyltransferase
VKRSLIPLLCCPACRRDLAIAAEEHDAAGEVSSGELACAGCARRYPIVRGVPRFVPSEGYAAPFGYQWNLFGREQIDRVNGTRISERRLLRETRWPAEWWPGKRVLDVGCGAGRFLDVAARLGAEVVGVDASSSVDVAYALLGHERGVHVVQADLFALPFADETFDAAYAIGVIQHTPDPAGSVRGLRGVLRPGGRVAVTCYERKPYTSVAPMFLLRRALRGLSPRSKLRVVRWTLPILFPLAEVLFRLPIAGRVFRFLLPVADPVDLPELSLRQRYRWALLDTFDVLAPTYVLPQTEGELMGALAKAGFANAERLRSPGLNITAIRP